MRKKKTEDFPVSEKLVREFIEKNRGKWDREYKSGRFVYINLSMVRLHIHWIFPKLLYGLGAADRLDAQPVVITWSENKVLEDMLNTLSIRHVSLDSILKQFPMAMFKSMLRTFSLTFFQGDGEDLKKVYIHNVPAGRAIYEDILRTSRMSKIRSLRNKVCFRKILHLLWMSYALDRYLKKNPPVFCVADDLAYHEGIILALMKQHGAKVFNASVWSSMDVRFDKENRTVRQPERVCEYYHSIIGEISEEEAVRAEQILKERFAGKNGRAIDRGAFKGKVLDREGMVSLFGMDPKKKNVVIMAHTFTDAIYNYGDLYFKDYYDWVEQTLKYVSRLDNVNWILKPHPSRHSYHEEDDSIEDLFEKYRSENLYILNDEISAESMRDFADVIVTIGGNGGREFACFGIPVVIIGKTYYKGFGYTIEPASRKEYEKLLSEIEKVPPLTEEQILTAKKVFSIKYSKRTFSEYFSGAFYDLMIEADNRMMKEKAKEMFESNKGMLVYNDENMKKLLAYQEKHDLKDSEYYQRGMKDAGLEK